MIKKILKSTLVLSVLLATVGVATRAWFTSTVTAADSQIEAGTLRVGVGTAIKSDSNYDPDTSAGYWVAYDDGTTTYPQSSFPPIEDLYPGGVKSFYIAVSNVGSLPLNYRFVLDGSWPDGEDRNEGDKNINWRAHRYAAGNCEGDWGCGNVRDWLQSYSYVWVSSGAGTWEYRELGNYITEGSSLDNLKDFTIYRVDVKMLEGAGNEYQDQAFTYDLTTEAKQTDASW